MTRFVIALAATVIAPFAAFGEQTSAHFEHASVSTYKPLRGFSQRIGERHFVGYFVASQNSCAVTG
jgi:hypothetical protein